MGGGRGGVSGEERVVLPAKAFIGWALKYESPLLSNCSQISHGKNKKIIKFSFKIRNILVALLPPQGFGLWAKTRGGTLGSPACIHTRIKKIC